MPFAKRSRSLLLHDPHAHGAPLGPLLEGTGVPLSADLHLMGRLEEGPSGLFLLLRTGDGGVWELEARRSTRGLIGCQVEVVGRRAGFNGLVCDQIWPAGQSRPRRSKFNLEYLLVGAFVAYGLITTLAGLAGYFG